MKYLRDIETRVISTDRGYDVIYESGEFSGSVSYVNYEMDNLLMRGKPVYLMVNSDMGDIIELIHSRVPLSGEDFNEINMEIRVHSRGVLLESFSSI